jgi:hypothetical protein
MLLHLAEQLEVPLRKRNVLLTTAGFAPLFPERALHDPGLQAARQAIDLVLVGIASALLEPPVNVLRLTLHPEGLASRIANLSEWRAHLFARLRHQIELTADQTLVELLEELSTYSAPRVRPSQRGVTERKQMEMVVPF